jgi:hypothetical protein
MTNYFTLANAPRSGLQAVELGFEMHGGHLRACAT